MSEQQRPMLEIEASKRQLHFFWVVDHSLSMGGVKIATVNQAIREVLPEVVAIAGSNPEVEMFMRAIKFSTGADWHVGPAPVPIESFVWPDISALGATSTARAIDLLCDQLEVGNMPRRGIPPVCVLVSDGFCTDAESDYLKAIKRLNELPWGKKAVRLAIAIGQESEYDEAELLRFVNHPEVGLLKAHTAHELINHIRWASTETTRTLSQSVSTPDTAAEGLVLEKPDSDYISVTDVDNEVF